MSGNQKIISGKANNISQVTNYNNNVVVNGISDSEFFSLLKINIEELQKTNEQNRRLIDELLKDKIDYISKKKNEDLSISDLGELMRYIKTIEIYSERPDKDLANILCDILSYSLGHNSGSILRISLHEAIDTARMLNQAHMKLLAFIFLIRNCINPRIHTWDNFQVFVKDILWRFAPDGLDSQILPKHLEYSKCTTFVAREMLISRMLTNSYLPAIQNNQGATYTKKEILGSFEECNNSNAIPESSRLSTQVFDLYGLDKSLSPNRETHSHYRTRKGNSDHKKEEMKVINLIKDCPEGERIYVEWAMSPIKNHVLDFFRNSTLKMVEYNKHIKSRN